MTRVKKRVIDVLILFGKFLIYKNDDRWPAGKAQESQKTSSIKWIDPWSLMTMEIVGFDSFTPWTLFYTIYYMHIDDYQMLKRDLSCNYIKIYWPFLHYMCSWYSHLCKCIMVFYHVIAYNSHMKKKKENVGLIFSKYDSFGLCLFIYRSNYVAYL